MSGFTDIGNIQLWNSNLINNTKLGKKYNSIVTEIENALQFIQTSSEKENQTTRHRHNFYTSHEALLIDYEESFLQKYKNKNYCCSGHMLWVGNRTRDPNSEQIKFL